VKQFVFDESIKCKKCF